MVDYSESFYTTHARRYAEVSHEFLQSIYLNASHPRLKGDLDLLERLTELAPGKRGLDAGCGAGARDVHNLCDAGFDVRGLDAVPENIDLAKELHPELKDRVKVHDLKEPLAFVDDHFDFLCCNAVIQHIDPEPVFEVLLPELVRVLKPKGVLQLMFKNGTGLASVYDKDYDSYRYFRLYDEKEILKALLEMGMSLIDAEGDRLGGVMYFTDPKKSEHCVFFMQKES